MISLSHSECSYKVEKENGAFENHPHSYKEILWWNITIRNVKLKYYGNWYALLISKLQYSGNSKYRKQF